MKRTKPVGNKLPQLSDTEKMLRAILENAPENIILFDRRHRVLCYNEGAKKTLYDYFRKEVKAGSDYRDFVIPALKKVYKTTFAKALRGETIELELETKGKVSHWFHYKMNPVYEPSGKLLGICLSAVNIDERKKAELALKDTTATFESLERHASEAIFLLDKNYKVLQVNQAARRRLRITKKMNLAPGSDIRDFMYDDVRKEFFSSFRKALKGEQVVKEVYSKLSDNSINWFQYKMFPVHSASGNLIGVGVITENTTKRKEAEHALKNMAAEFESVVQNII